MLVANTFDLWRKDSFFSAAEEVQESADILESAYRTWLRAKREGKTTNVVEELHRELHTALGTAKWQLEEFEKAVRLSHGMCRDQNRIARHQEFVFAMENQISLVESAFRETVHEEGNQPLRWVNLDDKERDDLAMFISGVPGNFHSKKEENIKTSVNCERKELYKKKDSDYSLPAKYGDRNTDFNSWSKSSKDEITIDMDSSYSTEVSTREVPGTRDDLNCQAERTASTRRTRTVPNFSSLQVVIPDENETLEEYVEATPKLKDRRMVDRMQVKAVNLFHQISRCSSFFRRKMQSTRRLPFGQSVRSMITLIAMLCLFVFFVLFST